MSCTSEKKVHFSLNILGFLPYSLEHAIIQCYGLQLFNKLYLLSQKILIFLPVSILPLSKLPHIKYSCQWNPVYCLTWSNIFITDFHIFFTVYWPYRYNLYKQSKFDLIFMTESQHLYGVYLIVFNIVVNIIRWENDVFDKRANF